MYKKGKFDVSQYTWTFNFDVSVCLDFEDDGSLEL